MGGNWKALSLVTVNYIMTQWQVQVAAIILIHKKDIII